MESIAKIRRMYHINNKGIKTIAKELNISKNTVKKVIRSDATKFEDTGLIFQDKFLLILLPFLSVAFKRHFVNNHDKHSLVFDNQCSNEIFDYYIYPCSY